MKRVGALLDARAQECWSKFAVMALHVGEVRHAS